MRLALIALIFSVLLGSEARDAFLYEDYPDYVEDYSNEKKEDDSDNQNENPVDKRIQCDEPAAPEFGSVLVVGRNSAAGSRAIFTCKEGREVVGSATSKCLETGEWSFPPPKCEKKCSVPRVDHGGIYLSRYRSFFLRMSRSEKLPEGQKLGDNEDLRLRCEDKYEPFGKYTFEEPVICNKGEWISIPRCEPAKCRRHPPEAANATTNSINGTHGEMAAYECKHPFQKVRQETMVCNFGQWEGLLPVCKNRNCIVHQINYGTFMEQVWTEKFSFRIFRNERSLTYQKIQVDSERAENSSAYVTCDLGYSFQGHGSYYNAVKCIHGDWSPHPICLPSGTFYKEKDQSTSVEPSTEMPKVSAPSIKTSTNRSQTTRLRSVLRTSRIPKSRPTQKPYLPATSSNKSCTCRYFSHDEHLVAYVGTKRLLPISEIDNNFKVKFFCEPFGYLELMGPSEITCQDCQWNSTIYPKCASPKTGETTLHINGDWQLLPGGIVGMKKGKILSISCEANGTGFVPQWNYSAAPRIHVENYLNYYSGRNASMLYIFQMDTIHEGKYQCFVPGYAPKIIEIQLLADLASVTCPKLEHDDLIIRYRRGQTVGSEALISCKQRHKVLVGRDRIRCLPSGHWSSHFRSRCEDVPGCIQPLKSTDSKLFIEPNKQFYRYGEMVLLSCPVGTILSSEVVRISCQRTGWSQKDLPECIDR